MFIAPMLLQSLANPPSDEENIITELKLDGIRLIFSNLNGKNQLYTRHNNEVTWLFPEIASINCPPGTVLDGELVAYGLDGKPNFELLQKRLRSKSHGQNINIQFIVFDNLFNNYNRITHKPLIERKNILMDVIPASGIISPIKWVNGLASSYFDIVKQSDLEGIVVKDPNSPYKVNTRSSYWKKIINYKFKVVLVNSFRKDSFGLSLTDLDGKPMGVMEHMSRNERSEFYRKATSLIKSETKNYVSLKQPLACKVKYRNYTSNGFLRIPIFVEWA